MKFIENDVFKIVLFAGLRLVVPRWCRFIAVDADGSCFAYSDHPDYSEDKPEWSNIPGGAVWHIGTVDLEGKGWQSAVEEI